MEKKTWKWELTDIFIEKQGHNLIQLYMTTSQAA